MERRSNYDITRDRLERDFLQYDQEAMLRRVPLRHDADYFYLTFLRRKLAFVGAHVEIRASRGLGYMLEETP